MNFRERERERDIEDIYWELKVREFAESFVILEINILLKVWREQAESLKRICWKSDYTLKVSWVIAENMLVMAVISE